MTTMKTMMMTIANGSGDDANDDDAADDLKSNKNIIISIVF